MTLGGCPLSIFCSHGTPPRKVHRCRGLNMKAKAIIWPWLPYVCRIRSTAGAGYLGPHFVKRIWHTSDSQGQILALAFMYKSLLVRGTLRIVKWFRGGLVCKAHRPLYHSTLGSRVMKQRRRGTLDPSPSSSPLLLSSLELSDTKVYEP